MWTNSGDCQLRAEAKQMEAESLPAGLLKQRHSWALGFPKAAVWAGGARVTEETPAPARQRGGVCSSSAVPTGDFPLIWTALGPPQI